MFIYRNKLTQVFVQLLLIRLLITFLFFFFKFLCFAISCFYSLFLAKLKRIPIYPFAPCTGILLDHQPFNLKETEAADIDLQFSGHTHHGQTWPINWVTDYICKATVIANGETRIYMYLPDCLYGDHLSE